LAHNRVTSAAVSAPLPAPASRNRISGSVVSNSRAIKAAMGSGVRNCPSSCFLTVSCSLTGSNRGSLRKARRVAFDDGILKEISYSLRVSASPLRPARVRKFHVNRSHVQHMARGPKIDELQAEVAALRPRRNPPNTIDTSGGAGRRAPRGAHRPVLPGAPTPPWPRPAAGTGRCGSPCTHSQRRPRPTESASPRSTEPPAR
jgi:hypothetical protein